MCVRGEERGEAGAGAARVLQGRAAAAPKRFAVHRLVHLPRALCCALGTCRHALPPLPPPSTLVNNLACIL